MKLGDRMGPNFKRLMIERASQLTVERAKKYEGSKMGGVVERMIDGSMHKEDLVDAFDWTNEACQMVLKANWYGYLGKTPQTEEEAAGFIMRKVDERKLKQQQERHAKV